MNRTIGSSGTALVVGAGGGVARAVLAVLAETPAGRALAAGLDDLLLLDALPAFSGRLPSACTRSSSPRTTPRWRREGPLLASSR